MLWPGILQLSWTGRLLFLVCALLKQKTKKNNKKRITLVATIDLASPNAHPLANASRNQVDGMHQNASTMCTSSTSHSWSLSGWKLQAHRHRQGCNTRYRARAHARTHTHTHTHTHRVSSTPLQPPSPSHSRSSTPILGLVLLQDMAHCIPGDIQRTRCSLHPRRVQR